MLSTASQDPSFSLFYAYLSPKIPQAGFEPATTALEKRCSIQLSYWGLKMEAAGLEPATARL